MTKYILPFLMFVSVGLSQGATAKQLADILQGADRKNVEGLVFDQFENLDKDLKAALETKLKLGMKRNKVSKEGKFDGTKWSVITIEVGRIKAGERTLGYSWHVKIKRYVRTVDGKHIIQNVAAWPVRGGFAPTSALLKEEIDTTLDKTFLAYLELKE